MPLRPHIARVITILALTLLPSIVRASTFDHWNRLSERERTFLNIVFSGDESRATEYVQAASINPNSIGGEPLSVWFYRLGTTRRGGPNYETGVQRVVFETFRQNPNPGAITDSNLNRFCSYAPFPEQLSIQAMTLSTSGRAGSPEYEQVLKQIAERQRPYVDAMAERFTSLLHYGLRDKAIINAIFAGCMSERPFRLTPEYYDRLIAPMVSAGVDLNRPLSDGHRPVEMFVKAMDPDMVNRMLRDHVQLNFVVRGIGCAQPTNLYVFFMDNLKPADPAPRLEMVRILSRAGLSPMKPIAYGGYQCRHASLYDAVLDTGNVRYAQAIKGAFEYVTGAQQPAPPSPVPADHGKDASQQSKPSEIGQWRIAYHKDGRPLAIAKATKNEGDKLAGLQLECVPGGRLEYIAPALKLFTPIRSLWINNAGDVYHVPLVNGRASGPAAVAISQQLLAVERAGASMGMNDHWTLEMSVDSEDGPMSEIELGGFSKMRAYMLANCRK